MNKNIQKLSIFSIIFTTFSICIPTTISIGNNYAYAYSKYQISYLNLTSGTSTVPIYSSISHNSDYRIKKGDIVPIVIYSKLPSTKTNIKLNKIENNASDIRVFVGNEKVKLSDIYSEINISEGESKSIYIMLYDSKDASDNDYAATYQLIVEREVSDTDTIIGDESDGDITLKDYGDIYLNRLTLFDVNNNKLDFDFDKTKSIFNINVDKDFSYINIKAVPEQESYRTTINYKEIDTKESSMRGFPLDIGKNVMRIKIISSDHEYREYFLIITRGTATAITSNTTTNTNLQNVKPSKGWQYKKADGTIATGWTCIENQWYYFDSTGEMKTGWFKDSSGKWYYLMESGVMAKNTVIDGYKIGLDGAYIA